MKRTRGLAMLAGAALVVTLVGTGFPNVPAAHALPASLLDVSYTATGPVDANGHTFTQMGAAAAHSVAYDNTVGRYVGRFDRATGTVGYRTTLTSSEQSQIQTSFT
ncbi:MAG: hypothetical protein LBR19_04695, partial [Bifidobacteriaceae bacterium]|nr:hypothetical protein [Bifidobacteriaceae bacterium]